MESTLRPGSLVSLKTSITGLNVNYHRNVLEAEHTTADGKLQAKWETEKLVLDAAEHEAAKKARADARNAIASACVQSDFGLLCPESNASKLQDAIAKAIAIVAAFNATAKLSHISVYTMLGKIEHASPDAVNAINSEVRDLLMDMESGIINNNVKMIRDAANKARALTAMLTNDPATKLETAIEWARDTARAIVKDGNGGAVAAEAVNVIAEYGLSFSDGEGL
jgi:hypothetical protein